MKVTSERLKDCQVLLNVELEKAEVEKGLADAYRRLVRKVKVPGFRPGKAPRQVLEAQLGRAALLEEALENLIPAAYEEAVKKEGLEAAARPKIELVTASPPVFRATVPLKPVVRLGNYREQMRIKPEVAEVTDNEVNRAVAQLREERAELVPVDRPARFGDVLTIDINGKEQGAEFLRQDGAACELVEGSASPLPGFAEKLVGVRKGEEKEFTLAISADHPNQAIAGKEYSYRVKVREVKEKRLPELDDEFARGLGSESLASWREQLVQRLRQRAQERSNRDFENKIMDEMVKLAELEYPPALVEQEVDRLISGQARGFKDDLRGLESYLKATDTTMEKHREEMTEVAKRRVEQSLVLEKAAEDEKIEVSSAEVDAEIERMVQEDPEHAEELRKLWAAPAARRSIERMLISRKTMARLGEIARGDVQTTAEVKQ
jgi:trigger factor